MVRIEWDSVEDAKRVVDALLTAAEHEDEHHNTILAKRYRRLADDVGDAIDRAHIPLPRGHVSTGVDTTGSRG